VTPLFLLSLPRSGSTLVQRVLASHPEVSTAPEPWLLLPQVFAMREAGSWARYGHIPAARAMREFAGRLPGGERDYARTLRRFVLDLYGMASEEGARYFLDKTPRYHLIAEELPRIFPEARLVFLWRNPLAVVASIIQTWGAGRWRPDRWRVDLLEGPGNLVAAYERYREVAWSVRYEDLILDPAVHWPRLFAYLDLEFDQRFLEGFSEVSLEARMGDRTGSARYHRVSDEPLEKWRRVLASPVRKRWCATYLRSLGAGTLEVMGYDLDELLAELGALPARPMTLPSDVVNGAYSWLVEGRRRAAARRLEPRRVLLSGRWPSEPVD
jgi:Sulfotransferase family